MCHKIVHLRCFNSFMIVVFVLSSISLAIHDPLDDNLEINFVSNLKYLFLIKKHLQEKLIKN